MPISDIFIHKILNRIVGLQLYGEKELNTIRYVLQTILWEIERFIYLLLIFLCINRLHHFLIATLTLLSIRIFAGGYHCKGSLGCFLVSLILFSAAVVVLPYLFNLTKLGMIIISFFSVMITLTIAPIYSLQKIKLMQKVNYNQRKGFATIITLVWIIIILLNFLDNFKEVILYILLLQNMQLLSVYLYRKLKSYIF